MSSDKLETVRRLLAKAERAATPEEAEAYTAKAVELMARHGIDDALLGAAGGKGPADELGQTRIDMDDPYSAGKARLLGWVGSPFGVRCVLHGAYGGKVRAVTLFGYASDRERVEVLYTSLLLQAVTQLNRVRPDDTAFGGGESVAAYRRSWLHGFAVRVHERLVAAQEAAVAQHDAPAASSGGPAPSGSAVVALRDRAAVVDQAYAEAFPALGKARRSTLSGTGFGAGAMAGSRADLGGGRLTGGRRALGGRS